MKAIRVLMIALVVLGIGATAAHARCCGYGAYTAYYAAPTYSTGSCCGYSSYYRPYYSSYGYTSYYSPYYSGYYSPYYNGGYWPRRYSVGYWGGGGCCW